MKTKLLFIYLFLSSIGALAQAPEKAKDSVAVKPTVTPDTPLAVTTKGKAKEIPLSTIQKMSDPDCKNCGDFDFIYDFSCNAYYRPSSDGRSLIAIKDLNELKVKYKKGFRFKIININKYLYSINLSYDDVFRQSSEPDLFKKFFLGEAFSFTPAAPAVVGGAPIPVVKTKMQLFLEKSDAFKSNYNKQIVKTFDAYSLCPKVECCEGTSDSKTTFISLSKELSEVKTAFYDFESSTLVSIETAENNKKVSDAALEKIKNDKNATPIAIALAQNNADGNNRKLSNLKAERLGIEKFKVQLDAFDDNKIMELLEFVNNIVADNFEYISPTIFPTGDRLLLKADINGNDSAQAQKLPLNNGWFDLDLRVRNKWFYSFSTGPFVGLSNQFKIQNYGWQKQPNADGEIADDSKYKLVKAGKEGMPVGIVALANFGTKIYDYYGIGVSIGAGATILDTPKLAYFAGITNFFGQDKQFNLTAGVSFIQVNELKKELYTGLGTQLYDAPLSNLEYTKKFVSGWFVSISYSVFTSSNVRRGEVNSGLPKKDPKPKTPETTPEKPKEEAKPAQAKPDAAKPDAAKPDAAKPEETNEKSSSILNGAKKVKIKYQN